MRSGTVVGCVAGGAIGLIGREGPRHGLGIRRMAIAALQGDTMVARICRGLMIEDERRPELAGMAVVTFPRRSEMTDAFSGCCCAVVTARTGSWIDVRMIEARRHPCRRRVADVALGRGLQMTDELPGRRHAVVTTRAHTDDLRVIDLCGRRETRYVMAVLADVARCYVSGRLTDGIDTVMAADAIACDVVVIEVGRQPRQCRVAVVTRVAARDMVRRFPGDNRVVVAARAGSNDLQVIDLHGRRESHDRVTVFAYIGCSDVIRRLADRVDAIVAVEAVARNVVVIEVGRSERDGRVAVLAIVSARYVSGVLAECGNAVVAAAARADYLKMIDLPDGRKANYRMTVLTDVCGVDVLRRLAH